LLLGIDLSPNITRGVGIHPLEVQKYLEELTHFKGHFDFCTTPSVHFRA